MNTVEKGNKLERQIYSLLNAEISRGNFIFKKENCKIYAKKGYYSHDRKKDIVFDVSIEVYLPGKEDYSVLILIECKNYKHPVPSGDVEEFYSKIQQVTGANVKGFIASTNSLQEGAFNYCRSKGLGFLRYYDKKNFKWELSRSPSSMVSAKYALNESMNAHRGVTIESYSAKYFDCYCYSNRQFTNSSRLFFLNLVMEGIDQPIKKQLTKIINAVDEDMRLVHYLDESAIEAASNKVLSAISYNNGAVPLNEISEWQEHEAGLRVILDAPSSDNSLQTGVLGKISFEPPEIIVYDDPDSKPERRKFTLAHEFGHWFLNHSEYMTGEYCEAQDFDFEKPMDVGIKDIMRMEWQANRFASCLLLPREPFLADFYSIAEDIGLQDKGFGILFLDDQRCNLDSYHRVTNTLKKKYGVSRSVVKIRLKKLGVLNETSLIKT
ncbi:MAG: ImmA/IrrE family metallo-endopeptidase [Gammaproteobacteria bacterium]|nr:ImmA/IrrE family metallo-endopeptidase [Gammaproteobacteria bacterium]